MEVNDDVDREGGDVMPYNYKFPSDVREEELEHEEEDVLVKLLGDKCQESGTVTISMPDNEYYKKIKYHFKNSKLSGMQYVYNEEGDRLISVNFIQGKRHGLYIRHHANGVIACVGTYKNGLPIGTWKFYDITGKHTNSRKY